ncbi:MAG: hypothetical protein ACLPQ0_05305 [Candidatus Binatus sp.]|jgi:hypothetical protein
MNGVARRPEVLWCPNNHGERGVGWSFPPAVDRHLRKLTAGMNALQAFGGRARWGIRLDIDPITEPHVIGDAWLLPFKRDAFDVVILDPPYFALNQLEKHQLLRAATWCARKWVIWFHTIWIAGDRHCSFERGWLVRVGDTCAVRCIQIFRTGPDKPAPAPFFQRGPALRYNRWLSPQIPLGLVGERRIRSGGCNV